VAARVLQGGHAVPAEVVVRRYVSSWRNFERVYKPLVNAWALYDNSGERPVLVEQESEHEI
jgi:predicted ABC-type ATPase